ncbi:unnamed protein product [Paramecium primaurelia]|uniref:Uncharacterized protein n=1 Tax=Paramecium primaurelia TaxID=5886 RepID=A0A8S1L3Q5_PARPR|nr:unnamed protein product [Paramecium primaurelia]
MNNRLLYYGICDILVCLVIGVVNISQKTCCFGFGISFIAELILMIAFVVFLKKNCLNALMRDCYLIISYMLCQILQIEFLQQQQSPEYMLFFIIRLLVLITVFQRIPFRITIFFIVYLYLCIRLEFYANIFPYIGLVFVPLMFKIDKHEQILTNLITEFFKGTITNPILIIDAETKQPLFHTNQIESEFNYSIANQKHFINTLQQFQDSTNKTLSSILDEQKLQSISGELIQYYKLQEISNEDYSFMDLPQHKKISTFIHDEINEDKQELVIESPKLQGKILQNQHSNQFNDDTPQLGKKSKFGQFKDSQYHFDTINELKQKKINIQVQHCIWDYKEAFMISLKDLKNQQMVEILNDELEESRKQNENKDQILATVFHDFKTPINGISTIVEAMEEKFDVNQQQKYYLRIIKKNVYLMLYMIQDILDFARIQKNQLRLSISDFYLNEIIEEVVELVAIQAEQKGVVITTHYDLPTYQIYSDPNRIKQILMNFISNSLKFTESGSITISVNSLQTDKSQHIVRTGSSKNVFSQQQNQQSIGQLRKQLSGRSVKSINGSNRMIYTITIADTGCGISELIKPKLFNMFATFPTKEVQNKCGTGIGLMVCKKLIKLLGPSENIDLWSEQNKGTKMSFQIYSRLQDDPKRSPNYISVFKQESSSKNFNIDSQSQFDDQQSIQQTFIRSSLLYVYSRPADKLDVDQDQDMHPEYEDIDQQKFHNINYMKNQRSPTVSKIKNKEQALDDSQDVIDPRNRLQRILQNKPNFSILIVDDQPFNVLALKLLLQDISQNITFLEAYNGQQAINKLISFQKQKNIKYIFMDLLMPILNGWQATEMIKDMIKKKQVDELKIIAISGYDDENEQERCGNIGFDAFITKPVRLEMIAEVFVQLEKV